MMTVPTLTRNIRLSKETIRRCCNIIENSDPNPHDKNRSTNTLAGIFYRNGGFDKEIDNEKINKQFSESEIKTILRGGLVDDLTVREFLFFLGIIPQTGDDIDAFLDNPSSNSIISPYPLTEGDIGFKGNKVFLLKQGLEGIINVIAKRGLSKQRIVQNLRIGQSIGQSTFYQALRGEEVTQKALKKILQSLIEQGVIAPLPEGQDLGQLLYPEAASSYTPTRKNLNITESCTDVGGGIQTSQLLLQPSPQQR